MTEKWMIHKNSSGEFKWTIAEPYERSRRLKHVFELENQEMTTELEKNAYNIALHYDENIWDVLNQSHSITSTNPINKRELLHNRVAERDSIQQKTNNPFFTDTEDTYVRDIINSDKYLKPQNTSI
jgi:hypothetical protein